VYLLGIFQGACPRLDTSGSKNYDLEDKSPQAEQYENIGGSVDDGLPVKLRP
jgi:hypothetical protein